MCSAVLMLGACGQAVENTQVAAVEPIVLLCDGHSDVGGKRDEMSYLIRVQPGNTMLHSIEYYVSAEKRIVPLCEEKGFNCKLSIGDDLITEVGEASSNGQVISQKVTEINRKTGTMKIQIFSGPNLPVLTSFDGTCQKSELPADAPKKF